MHNTPTEAQLATIPGLYQTEHIPTQDKIIHAHFYLGESHWFIAEYDHVDTMFGFCILNGDLEMAEWGFVSLEELKDINVLGLYQVQFGVHWTPKPAGQVDLIRLGGGIIADPRDEEHGGHWKWHTLQN
ncbi:DUF2958 domain-containing protein [Desulfobacter curvatus]|uniref:DUF2958 domain-containing protein n=1 Tax=Desulfobacter curvatus TaxID=2290 RepID=UPI000379DB89|nr:DUF2958 domain-containing protein [Desulfobacter curvatus]